MDALGTKAGKTMIEDDKLTALRSRNISLQQHLREAQARRLALLYRLSSLSSPGPESHLSSPPYKPSVSSHSTPSNIPSLTRGEDDVLMDRAKTIIKQHIKALHDYNEIKDVAQGLLGMIAESRGVRVRDLYIDGEFGVDEADGND